MLAHADDLVHVHPHPAGLPLELVALLMLCAALLGTAVVLVQRRNATKS